MSDLDDRTEITIGSGKDIEARRCATQNCRTISMPPEVYDAFLEAVKNHRDGFWLGFISGLRLCGALICWPFSKVARAHVRGFVWGQVSDSDIRAARRISGERRK